MKKYLLLNSTNCLASSYSLSEVKMEMTTRPHHGRGKDSVLCPAVLMKIKGELFHTNHVIRTAIFRFFMRFSHWLFLKPRLSNFHLRCHSVYKARFKRRILHGPNRIAKLSACKMRRLNQLNATYFNSMRVSRIFD